MRTSSVLPSNHNSDLPLPKCQLVYAILTRMSVHVAQVIVDAIYLFAGMPPTRHPRDYLIVTRTFRQPGANEPVDAKRLTSSEVAGGDTLWSSAPFVNRGERL